jgi:hypothetical protein
MDLEGFQVTLFVAYFMGSNESREAADAAGGRTRR